MQTKIASTKYLSLLSKSIRVPPHQRKLQGDVPQEARGTGDDFTSLPFATGLVDRQVSVSSPLPFDFHAVIDLADIHSGLKAGKPRVTFLEI